MAGSAIRDYALALSRNPAHGPVEVEFAVPKASEVSVVLFDLQGRSVATLAEGTHAVGRHAVRWEAASTAGPGIYFVRLRAPGRELVERLVVVP